MSLGLKIKALLLTSLAGCGAPEGTPSLTPGQTTDVGLDASPRIFASTQAQFAFTYLHNWDSSLWPYISETNKAHLPEANVVLQIVSPMSLAPSLAEKLTATVDDSLNAWNQALLTHLPDWHIKRIRLEATVHSTCKGASTTENSVIIQLAPGCQGSPSPFMRTLSLHRGLLFAPQLHAHLLAATGLWFAILPMHKHLQKDEGASSVAELSQLDTDAVAALLHLYNRVHQKIDAPCPSGYKEEDAPSLGTTRCIVDAAGFKPYSAVKPIATGRYQVRVHASKVPLALPLSTATEGAESTTWHISALGADLYQIGADDDILLRASLEGDQVVVARASDHQPFGQRWKIVRTHMEGVYQIMNDSFGQCLEVDPETGRAARRFYCNDNIRQRFEIIPVDG